MTSTVPAGPAAIEPVGPRRGWSSGRRAEGVGLVVLVVAAGLLVVAGVNGMGGDTATALLVVVGALLVALVLLAAFGGPEVRKRLAPYGLLKPGIFFLALFYLAPLFTLLKTSMSTKTSRFAVETEFSWTLVNYRQAFSDFGEQFGRGFGYAAAATVLCILIGYPLAYVIAFRGGRWRNLLLGLVVVPFFTSYLIRTIAWSSLLADRGPIIGSLRRVGLVRVFEWLHIMDNGRLLNTASAVIGGLTYNFLPFMLLPIYVSLEKINPNLLDAAQDLYSRPSKAFWRIVWPLSIPGVFAGTLLTFIPAAGDFVNAQYLGGPKQTMIGNSIQDQFLKQNNGPLASAMSFVLMAIITVAVLAYTAKYGTEDLQ